MFYCSTANCFDRLNKVHWFFVEECRWRVWVSVCIINLFRSFLWQIDLKAPNNMGGFYLIEILSGRHWDFEFGFQIKQYKLNKGLSSDRLKNHDGLRKYSSSSCRALPGGGNIPLEHPDPNQRAWLSFLKVSIWVWYRELVKYGH